MPGPGRLTPGDVARAPAPGTSVPSRAAFSFDDHWITYLHSPAGDLTQQLFALNVDTHRVTPVFATAEPYESEISLEEKLRKERARELAGGVTRYWWARHRTRLLIPSAAGLHVIDWPEGEPGVVIDFNGSAIVDPRLSPDGSSIAFVGNGEVCVVAADTGEIRQLTTGADPERGITHGQAEFIAQEEMGRAHGLWWSPDGASVAWTEVDESRVDLLRIAHLGSAGGGPAGGGPAPEEVHRYPFAGGVNATVRLAVMSVDGGDPTWFDVGAEDSYLARVQWIPDGSLVVATESRDQSRIDLWRWHPLSGVRRHLWAEEGEPWLNLHNMFEWLDDGTFVWASERSGYRHLWLHDGEGRPERQLTAGEWVVDSLDGIDQSTGSIWFSASREDPRQLHLYQGDLTGTEPRRVTEGHGTHHVVIDHAHRRFVDTWSSLERPPTVTVRDLSSGGSLAVVYDQIDSRIDAFGLRPPEMFSTTAGDGTTLYGAFYRPEVCPAPTVVSVYGGPHSQRVFDSWAMTASMRAQFLRSLGFCVLVLDNRGSPRRGLAFEAAISRDLGHLEVDDQVAGVAWAVEAGLTDPGRVGITGWSYGGYMSAMCLARAPETFAAAVAGAPVTAWDGYDTHYTERYMGTPVANAEGYHSSSVMTHVQGIRGRLLLIHGVIDENVHFRHTARLVQALVSNGIEHDLLVFPEERHMPRREEDRAFMEARLAEFFVRHLGLVAAGSIPEPAERPGT